MSEYIFEIGVREHGGAYKHQREEIVRCRDCKHGHEVEWPRSWDIPADYLDCTGKLTTTWDYYNDEPQANPVEPDGFCAWGERKQ